MSIAATVGEPLTGGQLVVRALMNEGVRCVFTVPGESFLPVLDALYDAKETIQVVTTRHEEGAGFAAEAYAKATGEAGVCAVTRGVGLANLCIALHTARQDSTPMVALVGLVPTSFKHREAFQEVDIVGFLRPLVKQVYEVAEAARIPEFVRQAFRVAQMGRPGPVVLGLPEDMLFSVTPDPGAIRPILPAQPKPEVRVVESVLTTLASSESPLILAGREVLTGAATELLIRLVTELEIPVMTAFRRFDAFPNEDDHYVGGVAPGAPGWALRPLEEADVIVALGAQMTQVTSVRYKYPRPDQTLIHVGGSSELVGAWGRIVIPVISGVREFLTEVLEELHNSDRTTSETGLRTERLRTLRANYCQWSTPELPTNNLSGRTAISAVLASIKKMAPPDTAIVTDAGNAAIWVARYYKFSRPLTHFGPISGAMGYAVPASIGVSLASRNRTVVALAGDGGFAMTMAELAVIRQAGLRVISVVLVNELYGTIRMHQARRFPGREIATDLFNPSFEALAQAFGIPAYRVASNAAFDIAFGSALEAGGPALIEVELGSERLSAWGPHAMEVDVAVRDG